MITIFTAVLVLGIIWGGFLTLLIKAYNSEKTRSENG
jgi:hypothetical protein